MKTELLIRYPRRRTIRAILKAGIALILSLIVEVKVEGRENLPKDGPALIVANHFSFLDPVAMILVIPHPLEFFGGLRTPNAPGWTNVFRQAWGVLTVRRGTSSRDALVAGQQVLDQKGFVCIFPEGGSWAHVIRPPRPGAALVAARSNAPIIPVGFDGWTEVFPLKLGRRARVTVRIGQPFGPYNVDIRDRSSRGRLDDIGHEMMMKIAELLPPERRGYCSDDPAIREAAKGTEIYPWEGVVEE